MSKQHKHQHFVPQSYLSAWTDKSAPPAYDPYVWVRSRAGEMRRRAPKGIFHENDMYTFKTSGGERDLRLERQLSIVENDFAKVRRRYLERQVVLSEGAYIDLCSFAASLLVRARLRMCSVADTA
ncbi:DUF4238 domain-containing protein [Geminicoccus sp.]|uniref:DUF4238 domain-containing protein n=1 Tax=Geminicoccus sp. TaxID=2024832 RepID=UPI0039C86A8D